MAHFFFKKKDVDSQNKLSYGLEVSRHVNSKNLCTTN